MKKKILLIEDDEINMELLTDILSYNNYSIETAENGELGIEKAFRTNPDLILMDILMPIMDGIEATKVLKSDIRTKHIPIVALTAFAMKGDKEKILTAGCSDYLIKPFQVDNLLEIVKKYI